MAHCLQWPLTNQILVYRRNEGISKFMIETTYAYFNQTPPTCSLSVCVIFTDTEKQHLASCKHVCRHMSRYSSQSCTSNVDLTVLQSELTSQWEQRRSWQACVDSGGVRLAQRCGWTMVERFPKLCLHWSCLCCTPGPQDTLHSDHALASQLSHRQ